MQLLLFEHSIMQLFSVVFAEPIRVPLILKFDNLLYLLLFNDSI